jgi:hypothetical protein
MRRFDKLKNINKVNLLNEVRYLESKGLISEEHITVKKDKESGNYKIYKGNVFLGRVVQDEDGKNWKASDEDFQPFDTGSFNDMVAAFGKRKERKKYKIFYNGDVTDIDFRKLIYFNDDDFLNKEFNSKISATTYINNLKKVKDVIDKLEIR